PTPTPTPKELPKTGPETIVTGVIGLGSVVTTAGYYIASRKQLR
ncbi:MAG: LPXTG cell wall anchor domain-containing protein, partial [Candidatus Nanosynbacter sp.]|nr:LPXTG cell wall anchor domain-containing protein [Candidatus Nanosynbacter sp.]